MTEVETPWDGPVLLFERWRGFFYGMGCEKVDVYLLSLTDERKAVDSRILVGGCK
jgi:hypothetical protein